MILAGVNGEDEGYTWVLTAAMGVVIPTPAKARTKTARPEKLRENCMMEEEGDLEKSSVDEEVRGAKRVVLVDWGA